MLTPEEIEQWDVGALRQINGMVKPDPSRPYIVCPVGTGTRERAVMFDGEGSRITVVVRTVGHGEIMRKAGFEWADLRKPFKEQPMRCVVTLLGLPKLGRVVKGDYLIAGDWRMLADRKTKIFKYFRMALGARRFCIASQGPHPWAAYTVMCALGNADKGLRAVTDLHKARLAVTTGTGQVIIQPPDCMAVGDIKEHFTKFIDNRAPQV